MRNLKLKYIHHLFLFTILLVIPFVECFREIHKKEIFVLTTGLWGLFFLFTNRIKNISITKIDIVIIVYILYEFCHYLILSPFNIFSVFFWKRICFALIYFIIKSLYNIYSRSYLKELTLIIIVKVAFELIIGSLQYFKIFNFNKSEYFTVVGTFYSPNYFAYSLVFGLLLIVWYTQLNWKILNIYYKLFIAIIAISIILLLTTTDSKAAIVSLVVCLGLYYFKLNFGKLKKIELKNKLFLVAFLITLTSFFFIRLNNSKEGSTKGRFFVAKIISKEIIKNPIFGHGLYTFPIGFNTAKANFISTEKPNWNTIKNADYGYSAMNDYLEILYETGIISFFLLIVIFIKATTIQKMTSYGSLGFLLFTFLALTAIFSSVHRVLILVVMGIIALVFCQENYQLNKIKLNKLIIVIPIYIATLLLFLLTTSISILKLQTFKSIKSRINDKELVTQISKETWDNWTKICSTKGGSEFSYGRILYKYFDKKDEGLKIMESVISKNIRPEYVQSLAYFNYEIGNYKRANELFLLNVNTQPFKYEPKINLMKFYHRTNQIDKLCELTSIVINFPVKVPSKEIDDYKKTSIELLEKLNCK